eukprot:scaffold1410_cov386-Prasinococcus_capsulatus_cf.AAC.4
MQGAAPALESMNQPEPWLGACAQSLPSLVVTAPKGGLAKRQPRQTPTLERGSLRPPVGSIGSAQTPCSTVEPLGCPREAEAASLVTKVLQLTTVGVRTQWPWILSRCQLSRLWSGAEGWPLGERVRAYMWIVQMRSNVLLG